MLIQVAAAAINNTDVNTRIGWYPKAITAGTGEGGAAGFDAVEDVDATWSGTALEFPRIQTSHGSKVSSGGGFQAFAVPGGGLVVAGVVAQAAVQDADESVGQGPEGLVVAGAAGALGVVVGPRSW